MEGQVISWSSAGKMGLEVLKRILLMRHKWLLKDCSKVAFEKGLKKRVKVYVKGPGQGRESAIRTLHNSGIIVTGDCRCYSIAT